MSREAAIVDAIVKLIHDRGGWIFKTHGTIVGRRGIPDLSGAYRGRALALEVKRPGQQPTRLQRHELAKARAAGAVAEVVRSAQEVELLLDRVEREREAAAA